MAMSYPAALDVLFGLQRHGIKLGLETVSALLANLGRPQDRYPCLHIGGTNGKGSTAAIAAAVLQAAGYRVGLYTSPHLVEFRERIRVDGEPIEESVVAELTGRLREAAGDPPPTFFEFTTAMAFTAFAEAGVEVAVVEVGLGGRFDATNVITPLAAAITNVSLDHQEHLGATVGAIAFEKAGIVKPGTPLVTGRLSREAAEVIGGVVAARGAPWLRLDEEFTVQGETESGFDYRGPAWAWRGLACPLAGRHQLDNAGCAVALLEAAAGRGLRIPPEAVVAGVAAPRWEGRLETVGARPRLVLDGAHNPAAGEAVADYLSRHRLAHPGSRVLLVFGMMRDKDRAGFLRPLLPLADEIVLTRPQLARAATVEELADTLRDLGRRAHAAPLPADALALAERLASPDDLICVTGSLMLVGDVKALLRGCALSPIRG